MADDKRGRESQAANAERRQRKRELEEARERGEEAEPPAEDDLETPLGDLADGLANHVYPTTAAELQDAFGEREVELADGSTTVDGLLADVDDAETYDSAEEARRRVQELRRAD